MCVPFVIRADQLRAVLTRELPPEGTYDAPEVVYLRPVEVALTQCLVCFNHARIDRAQDTTTTVHVVKRGKHGQFLALDVLRGVRMHSLRPFGLTAQGRVWCVTPHHLHRHVTLFLLPVDQRATPVCHTSLQEAREINRTHRMRRVVPKS